MGAACSSPPGAEAFDSDPGTRPPAAISPPPSSPPPAASPPPGGAAASPPSPAPVPAPPAPSTATSAGPSAAPLLWDTPRRSRPGWREVLARAHALASAAPGPADVASAYAQLTGALDAPAESTSVYLFISSTFTDTRAERNAFLADVLPFLREVANAVGLSLAIVDMRWGIRDEATKDHKTSEICMQELRRCKARAPPPAVWALTKSG